MLRLTLALLFLFSPVCLAGNGILPEAKHEAARRGNHVEYVRGGAQASEATYFAAAMQTPADDSHKWFISVVCSRNCPQCERLKQDFASSPALRPYVNTTQHQESWAHYNVFRIEDQLQGWRFEKLKLSSFPVIIIQPPINGRFGESTKYLPPIVGYDGNAAKLAATIRERIRTYVESLDSHAASGPFQRFQTPDRQQNKNLDPPFVVLPPENEDQTEQPPFSLPSLNPQDIHMSDPLMMLLTTLAAMFGSGGLTVAVGLGLGGFLLVREYRKSQGKKLLVSDTDAAKIEQIVESILAKKLAPSSPPSAS